MSERTIIDYFKSIDGNMIRNPVGYCTYHRGYVSQRQAMVHKCYRKHGGTCGRLTNMRGKRVRDMTQQQFYDKMISRMDKMCGSLNKIVGILEAIQKKQDTEVLHKYAEGEKE